MLNRKGVVASIDDTASYSIVAMCGKTEKVFEIPYPETVELEKLKKTNPRVAFAATGRKGHKLVPVAAVEEIERKKLRRIR